jgi:hypothetical protein
MREQALIGFHSKTKGSDKWLMPTSVLSPAHGDLNQQIRDWLVRMTPQPRRERSRVAVTLTFDQRQMLKGQFIWNADSC